MLHLTTYAPLLSFRSLSFDIYSCRPFPLNLSLSIYSYIFASKLSYCRLLVNAAASRLSIRVSQI